ncbi:ABC transporter ATP-binding protein [Nonomuraea sp. KC401]|uniref:ABC transporter ATP-binding protein n=1 Tax=unclassified Nonomuraea TaxID=2593643 RepID=UPI0010FF4FBE|nr:MULTISPECIES: ABC transporter ATP-binding protein [unclassified Nonomuraea]NBE93502.1 dipeptide ABC transporter ATP-binding protein [Nonomuraea sp. K271]TLF81400.1 ABC transporter ATP-binding protein [Nonomuraea sp. KC401]
MSPLLEIRDLSVAFRTRRQDVTVVKNVSMEILPGQTVAVVGESGSGKSTTAAAVNRLLPGNGRITGGQVLFEGRDLATASEREMTAIRGAGIGLVPQDPMSNLNPLMRIGDQIAEALEVHGVATGKAARARVVELLDMAGITDPERRIGQYPHEFSGGMRQRALIAMGLACRPRLLIADEPTSALDVTVQRRILDQLARLTADMGTAVFLITHDLALAAERADVVAVMYQGEIVETGPAAAILAEPGHEYTRRLLKAVPSLSSVRLLEPPRASDDLVVVEDLRKVYPLRGTGEQITAVDAVSFTIPRGSTVSIVGESGSGKSTTANLLLGLDDLTSGRIRFDGTDVTALGGRELFAFRRRVQPVFQNPYASLDPRYTVGKSVAEPLRVHRVGTAAERRRTAAELLEKVSLPASTAGRLPHELSGGQRQRVAIARALALAPELVVLDEAVSALDVLVQAQILELLAGLQRELGLSYLFISHDLAVVRMISHAVHVMREGRIVESGTAEEIFDHPSDDYTRELLAAIPGTLA